MSGKGGMAVVTSLEAVVSHEKRNRSTVPAPINLYYSLITCSRAGDDICHVILVVS